jgi:hypothetical protein
MLNCNRYDIAGLIFGKLVPLEVDPLPPKKITYSLIMKTITIHNLEV